MPKNHKITFYIYITPYLEINIKIDKKWQIWKKLFKKILT
jgi:hypothetical protein